MAGYVGNVPVPQSVREDQSFTATAGQTTFNTLGYTDGNRIKVTLNGVLLEGGGVDYTATNGSDVVLTSGATADDIVRFETFNEVNLVSSVTTTPTFKTSATLLNETEEDIEGGRESTLIFQGEQSGGELTTLAEIEASHDGTADDQKGDLIFRTNDGNDGTSPTERLRINSGGDMLFSSEDPSLTLANTTHEDSDGGRESTIAFQGEQSGGEISLLAQIEAAHDGTADDQKGDLIFRTNDGSDGTSPTEVMRVDSSGQVGIGLNDPNAPLVVAKDGTSHTAAAVSIRSTQAGGYGSILNFESTQTGGSAVTAASIGTQGTENYSDAANSSSALLFSTIKDGTFAEKWRITSDGNLKPATNGKGIDFSASENSGVVTDGSILGDYEEGTFTGTVNGYYGNPSSAVTATGQYTLIGNMVTYMINFENVNTTGASGDITVLGLPFAHNGAYTISPCQMSPFGVYPSSAPYGLVSGNITYFRKHVDSSGDTACFHSAGTGRYLRVCGTFRIA